MYKDIFSTRLKEIRMQTGKTQREFAEMVQSTAATISAYENATKNPSLEIVMNIAEKCNISIDWLCGLSENKKNNNEVVTFADMLLLVIKLSKLFMPFEEWTPSLETNDSYDDNDEYIQFATLKTSNRDVVAFFKDWIQMYDLFQSGTIDEHLYNLWISDRLKQYAITDMPRPCEPGEYI